MSTHLLETPTIGLGRIISDGNRFTVPHHQRDYSWGEDEVSQLFLDFEDTKSSSSDYFFLGLMVFIPSENSNDLTILDGQQRMATSIIILSAVRNWLINNGYEKDADQIQSTYIASRELGEEQLYPRMILNEINNYTFYNYVVSEKPTTSIIEALSKLKKYDPNRFLMESIVFCREEIYKIALKEGDPKSGAKKLFEIVKFIRDSVRIVRLTVPSEADAYIVFETLNDRGLDLSVLDLVKNYIFGKAGSKTRLEEIKSRWTQMMANLSNVRGDDFLKVYWTSRNGRTQKNQLFPNIKKNIKSPEAILKFSVDLLEASEHFAAVEIADDPLWEGYTDKARERIRTLKLLRSQSIHPVLLSGLARFLPREMDRLLWLLEVFLVRYQLIGGGRTGLLEIATAKLAADIYKGEIKNASEAFRELKSLYPTDQEFREAFIAKQEKTNNRAQYILRNIEEEMRRKDPSSKTGVELSPKTLTVEHIFPRGSGPEWKDLVINDPSFHEDCLYRLGNLTLLGKVNKDLGQKGFEVKKKTYGQSNLLITKELDSLKDWNRKEVEKRQKEMAKHAVLSWRFQ